MSEQPADEPYSDTHLESPEYRERLRRKLDCLITVLEVACAKVRRTLEAPGADRARLERILANLRDTLATCERARVALARKQPLPADLDRRLAKLSDAPAPAAARRGAQGDFRDDAERRRFEGRAAIDRRDVRACDLDELARRLQGG